MSIPLNIVHLDGTAHSAGRRASFIKQLIEQEITNFRIWPGILDLSMPFRGICRAHKQIVKNAKDKGLPQVCIMEDDVIFFGKGAFDFFIKNIPDDYDIYFGSISTGEPDKQNIVTAFSGMSLYIVRERFYDTFLSVKETANIDGQLSRKGLYKLCPEMVCYQMDGYSYNKKAMKQYSKLSKKYKTYSCEQH
jgi:GR25 family glycosyltransferase involved in LPS biosynthesis